MCEGKFLVKTNVSDNHVIRQVTVENFRFGVRVVKKTEGSWTCQDLNVKEGGSGSGDSGSRKIGPSGCENTSYHSVQTKKRKSDDILTRDDTIFDSVLSPSPKGNGNNKSVIRVDIQDEETQSSDNPKINVDDPSLVKNIHIKSSPCRPVPQEDRPSSKLYVALSSSSTSSSAPHTSSLPTDTDQTPHQGTTRDKESSHGERPAHGNGGHSVQFETSKELLSLLSSSKSNSSSPINSTLNTLNKDGAKECAVLNTNASKSLPVQTKACDSDSDALVGGEQTVAVNNNGLRSSLYEAPTNFVLYGPSNENSINSKNHSILYKHLSTASESLLRRDNTNYTKCLNYSSTSTSRSRFRKLCSSRTTEIKQKSIIPGPQARTRGLISPSQNQKNKNCPTQYQKSSTEFPIIDDSNSDAVLKNPYLTKILGSSPLLKLQLLNLLVVPLDDQRNKFPDLIPRQNISRLKMLFDEDGNERVGGGGGSGTETDREQKRSRDKDLDDVDLKKRVKMEPEDEDNLVIDENMGYGEELSENDNSEDLSNDNDEGARMDLLEVGVGQQNSVNASNSCAAGGNRSSSDSSYTSSSRNKKLHPSSNSNSITFAKNGHDTNVSRVPKLSSSQALSSKFNSNYDECNNLGDNAESNSSCGTDSKMVRLEREIAALTSLLKTKEKEWNAILRLKKLKEMNMEFLRRQKDVDDLFEVETIQQHEEYLKTLTDRINIENDKIGSDEAHVRLSIEKTEKEIKMSEKKIKNNRVHVSAGKGDQSKEAKQNDAGHMDNFKASLALQQLCERNRTTLVQANSPVQLSSGSPNIQNKVIGEGRQGTIVEVKSIIADYRSKNPEETGQTSEARRRVQKKGSSSTPSLGSSIISQNRNVSFKDVLVNLSKLAQNEKSSGPAITTATDSVTVTPRGTSKTSSSMLQASSYGTSRGQLGTTLAKLLSSNSSSSNIPVGIVHPDGGGSVSSIKIDAVNHAGDSNLSLANLLASAKCRDDEIKTEEEDMVPICQGCNANRAQFVCAGCGNQWYCCRECQIQAWEDHSEVCSG